jgi:hypothetical protein
MGEKEMLMESEQNNSEASVGFHSTHFESHWFQPFYFWMGKKELVQGHSVHSG